MKETIYFHGIPIVFEDGFSTPIWTDGSGNAVAAPSEDELRQLDKVVQEAIYECPDCGRRNIPIGERCRPPKAAFPLP